MRLLALLATLVACGSKHDRPRARVDAPTASAAVAAASATLADAGHAVDAATTPLADAAIARRPSSRCRGLPPTATVEALPTRDGVHTFHVHAGDGDRWLVFDGPRACHVSPVGRAEARTRGAFWPGQGEVKAFALRGGPCEADGHPISCPAVVGLRDDRGVMLDAIEACEVTMAPGLHRAAIFTGQDSLIVSCMGHAGYGLSEVLTLLHVVDGRLRVVLSVDGSEGDHGESVACTGCKAHCWAWLDEARWEVLEGGAMPRLRTQAPLPYLGTLDEAETVEVLAATRNLVRWRFDPSRGVFVVERDRYLDTRAVRDKCAPYPPGSPLRRP